MTVVVRRLAPAVRSSTMRSPQLGDRHLAVALLTGRRAGTPSSGSRLRTQAAERRHLVFLGACSRACVDGACRPRAPSRPCACRGRRPCARASRGRRPAGRASWCRRRTRRTSPHARQHVADVEDAVREVLEEDAGLDLALGARRDHAEGDLPKGLVRVRAAPRSSRRRSPPSRAPPHGHGPQQPIQAHPARLHRHPLAVGRQAAEGRSAGRSAAPSGW